MTGASHSILPSSTSRPSAVAVNTFVFDAMPNSVFASTRRRLAQLADAVALRDHHAVVLHDGERDAGHLERLHRAGDPGVEVGTAPAGTAARTATPAVRIRARRTRRA